MLLPNEAETSLDFVAGFQNGSQPAPSTSAVGSFLSKLSFVLTDIYCRDITWLLEMNLMNTRSIERKKQCVTKDIHLRGMFGCWNDNVGQLNL